MGGRRAPATLVAAVPLIAALLMFYFVVEAEGIWLNLPATGTKCVSEEILHNVVVLADYVVVSADHTHYPAISVKVTSPYGNNLHHKENVTHGQFAFTSDEAGSYLACFWADNQHQGSEVSVNLDWKIGIAAKDWESVAKKEKIEGVELELRKLEGAVEAIHENLLYLRSREADMRIVSEKTNATVQASFKLKKPVSELITCIGRLEYELYGEIGAPGSKVAVLFMHQAGSSKYTDVVFGVLPDPPNVPIDELSLILLRFSIVELFLQLTNLTLTATTFGQTSDFQILKFPGGVAVVPERSTFIGQMPQFLFNFSLNNSIYDIKGNFITFRQQLEYGLRLEPYENVCVVVTNAKGSTLASSVTVQATVVSDMGNLLPERMKELAETIKVSSSNLGLDNSQFGKVKSVMLSSYLNRTIADISPSPSPAPSPGSSYEHGLSASPSPAPSSYPPVPSPIYHHVPHCVNCELSPSPTMEPSSSVPYFPPAQSPDSHCLFSPRISPQDFPFNSNQASLHVFPCAYAPATPTRNQ